MSLQYPIWTITNAKIDSVLAQLASGINATAVHTTQTLVNQPFTQATAGSGNVGQINTSPWTELAIDIKVTAITGVLATITYMFVRYMADGVTVGATLATSTAITVVNGLASFSLTSASGQSLGSICTLTWTLGGTSPSATFTVSVIGKV